MCEICSELTLKKLERRHWRRSGVFIVNFEQKSHIALVFPLLTLSKWLLSGKYSAFIEAYNLIINRMARGKNMMENNQIGLKCLLECRNQILVFYQKLNIYLVIIFHHVFCFWSSFLLLSILPLLINVFIIIYFIIIPYYYIMPLLLSTLFWTTYWRRVSEVYGLICYLPLGISHYVVMNKYTSHSSSENFLKYADTRNFAWTWAY